jgi:hypothetical protein
MNRRWFHLLLLILLIVVGVGFYRGWFVLSSARETTSNRVNINLTVDPDRVKEDADRVKEKTSELTEGVTDSVKSHDQPDDSQQLPE